MTIGQVAARAGLNASHIRYYEEIGVLPAPARVSGQRRYDDDVLGRLAIIDVAQRAGLTLEEIRDLTGPQPEGREVSSRIRELAERKLPDIDALIERAQAVRRWLQVAPAPATARPSTFADCLSTRNSCRPRARSSSRSVRSAWHIHADPREQTRRAD
jgi:DNA-binding transcriptional MerR regulator